MSGSYVFCVGITKSEDLLIYIPNISQLPPEVGMKRE